MSDENWQETEIRQRIINAAGNAEYLFIGQGFGPLGEQKMREKAEIYAKAGADVSLIIRNVTVEKI